MRLLLLILLTFFTLQAQIRVNVGGPQYTDSNGNVWAADNGCTSQSTYSRSGAIKGTNDPTLYRTGRIDPRQVDCAYTPLSPAFYTVTLLFAETDPRVTATSQSGGQPRVMNVYINGQLYWAQLNVLASSAFATAYNVTSPYISIPDGQINIQVIQVAYQAMLSGIDIEPVSFINTTGLGVPATSFGADPTGAADSCAAFKTGLASTHALLISPGFYKSSCALPIVTGQTISCAGQSNTSGTNFSTIIEFTGATDGIAFTGAGQINNAAVIGCTLVTNNAAAGKAFNFSPGNAGAGIILQNDAAFNVGGGAWACGVYGDQLESSTITNWYSAGLTKHICLSNQSNAVSIVNPLITASGTTGIEVDTSQVFVYGGTLEGVFTQLQNNITGTLYNFSTYMENAGGAHEVLSSGTTLLYGDILGGNSITDSGILQTGGSKLLVDGLTGSITTPASIIEIDGNNAGSAENSEVRSSEVINNSSSTSSHALTIGTGSTGLFGINIAGGKFSAAGTVMRIQQSRNVNITGTSIFAATNQIAVDTTGNFSSSFFGNTYSATDAAHIYNGVTGGDTSGDCGNYLIGVGDLGCSVGTVSFLGLANVVPLISGKSTYCTSCDTPMSEGATCSSSGDQAGALAYYLRGAWRCY